MTDMRIKLDDYNSRLINSTNFYLRTKKMYNDMLVEKLSALNPMAVLERGYSITRTYPDKQILTDTDNISQMQLLETILLKGRVISKVEKKE